MSQRSTEIVSRSHGYAPRVPFDQVVQHSDGKTGIGKRLVNVKQAAEYLGRTPKSIRHLVERRKLQCIRADGRVMFDLSDLDAWIDMNRV
jgi:excisionase family DNA binding protein